MFVNSQFKYSVFFVWFIFTLGLLPRVSFAALVETINVTDLTLDSSQIGPVSGSSVGLQSWKVDFPTATNTLNSGDMIAINIDFAGTQKLQISNPGDTFFVPFISARPGTPVIWTADEGTNVYDFTMEFTDVEGDLKQNNFSVDITAGPGYGISQVIDVTDSFFNFADLHLLLTANEVLTLTGRDLQVQLRAGQIDIIGEAPTVPVPAVPVPAAVWLFGSALIGLVGLSKRRKTG